MTSKKYWEGMVGDNLPKIKLFSLFDELLSYDLKEFADNIAVSWLNNQKTYKELVSDIGRARKVLVDKGVKPKTNVAIVFKNDYDFVKTFFAITTLGAVAVLVPPSLPAQALLGSIKKFDSCCVVYGDDVKNNINEISSQLKDVILISRDELNSSSVEAPANPNVKPSDAAAIIFTGGTTGTPKGAVLSQRALLRSAYNGSFVEGKVFFNKYLVLVPFIHVFGLVRNLLTSMNTGSNVYLVKDNMRFFEEVRIAQPDIMIVVPALANLIYGVAAQYGKEALGGKLDYLIVGGASTPSQTIKKLLSVGIKCCPGYGLTETANLVSGSINYSDKPDSVGMIYPNQEVKIVNDEILVKGDNLFDGYYKDPIETKNAFTEDGYFKTGDLGKFDEDGFLYITGRNKNIIVLDNGEKISPEIIEAKLDDMPLVHSSLVYTEPGTHGRDIICAKIFPNYVALKKMGITDTQKSIQEVVDKVNSLLPKYMNIAKFIILEKDFKRSASMKIIRKDN